MFTLFNFIICLAIYIAIFVTQLPGLIFLYILYGIALIIPSLAVTVRRLHDAGHSGWWYFISLIPFVGGIILLVMLCEDSQDGDNKYGPNPKDTPDSGTYGIGS